MSDYQVSQDDVKEAAQRAAESIARQSHNDYHEPVWGVGRARLAAQQVQFELENVLRKHQITDPTPAMIEAGAKVIASVAYGDFAKALAEDCYCAMMDARDKT